VPAFNILQCGIHERLKLGIKAVGCGGNQGLTTAFFRKAGRACVRYPDLHRAQAGGAQGGAVFLYAGGGMGRATEFDFLNHCKINDLITLRPQKTDYNLLI